jgi:RNA-dependent RNA polymerase
MGHVPVSLSPCSRAFINMSSRRPPPKQALPQQLSFGQALVRLKELRDLRLYTVPSPINPSKRYPERNILFANSVDFGTHDAEKSLIKMRTVHAPGRIQLMLNLERKELDIQFPLEVGDKLRKFRFRLPIALLSHIYKDANCDHEHTALIIPFGSAPQFFIQKFEGEQLIDDRTHTSFSTKENPWIDWYTWFRETDVVDPDLKKSRQAMPIMARKDNAIIDIGRSLSVTVISNCSSA